MTVAEKTSPFPLEVRKIGKFRTFEAQSKDRRWTVFFSGWVISGGRPSGTAFGRSGSNVSPLAAAGPLLFGKTEKLRV